MQLTTVSSLEGNRRVFMYDTSTDLRYTFGFFLFHIHINVCHFTCTCTNFPQLNFKADSDGNGALKMNMEKKHSKCLLLTHHSSLKTQKENSIFP